MEQQEIKPLLDLLATHGGKIVSTASLDVEEINQSRASGRMYVDENSLGYAWIPHFEGFPETEEEIRLLEEWYPLPIEMPEELKTPDWLFKKIEDEKRREKLINALLNNQSK